MEEIWGLDLCMDRNPGAVSGTAQFTLPPPKVRRFAGALLPTGPWTYMTRILWRLQTGSARVNAKCEHERGPHYVDGDSSGESELDG